MRLRDSVTLVVAQEVWLRRSEVPMNLREKPREQRERGRWSGPHTVTKVGRVWATVDAGSSVPLRVRLTEGNTNIWKGEYQPGSVALTADEVETAVWFETERHTVVDTVAQLRPSDLEAVARLIGYRPAPPRYGVPDAR